MKTIILFFIIFDPQIPYFIEKIGFTAIVFLVLLIGIFFKKKSIKTSYVITAIEPFIILFILLLISCFLVLMLHQGNVLYMLSILKAIFVFGAISSYLIFFDQRFDNKFIQNLMLIFLINAIINFVAGTFPENFSVLEVFRGVPISNSLGENPYRNNFISGSGYYSIGTAYGLFFMLYLYATVDRTKTLISYISILVIVVAGLFAARTSVIAIFAGLLYLAFKIKLKNIISLGVVATLIIYYAFGENGFLEIYSSWLLSVFDPKNDESGRNLIEDMYFWPGDKYFLLGSGAVNDGRFDYTDSGFMQDIIFGGIFYSFLKFCFPIYFIIKFFKNEPLFVLFFLIVAIIFQAKGAYFINNSQGMTVFYLMFFLFSERFQKLNK
jgi:hypothetical protein